MTRSEKTVKEVMEIEKRFNSDEYKNCEKAKPIKQGEKNAKMRDMPAK